MPLVSPRAAGPTTSSAAPVSPLGVPDPPAARSPRGPPGSGLNGTSATARFGESRSPPTPAPGPRSAAEGPGGFLPHASWPAAASGRTRRAARGGPAAKRCRSGPTAPRGPRERARVHVGPTPRAGEVSVRPGHDLPLGQRGEAQRVAFGPVLGRSRSRAEGDARTGQREPRTRQG